MPELIKNSKIDFVSLFKYTSPLSAVLVLSALYFSLTSMKYGVDFRGGAEIQLKTASSISLDELRNLLKEEGFGQATVQTLGDDLSNEYLIKVQGDESNLNVITQKAENFLMKRYDGGKIRKVDIVGPKAGKQLRISGLLAMMWALIAVMVYIGLRFDFKYSPGAIVALFHDVTIILGIMAITGKEFTLQIVASLLAVIGYSVNDTVIVYDRVREQENIQAEEEKEIPLTIHLNKAINSTLARTILTSGTTLFISITMCLFGGLAIYDFFFAISWGVLIGTYSSIFVAAPVTLLCHRIKQKKEEKTVVPKDDSL